MLIMMMMLMTEQWSAVGWKVANTQCPTLSKALSLSHARYYIIRSIIICILHIFYHRCCCLISWFINPHSIFSLSYRNLLTSSPEMSSRVFSSSSTPSSGRRSSPLPCTAPPPWESIAHTLPHHHVNVNGDLNHE